MARTPQARHLFPAQRRALVLDYLRTAGAASVPHLCDALSASPATIRRDLDFLTSEGYLDRSHGGAVLKPHLGTTSEPDPAIEAETAHEAKARIGSEAARLIRAGQSVIFDSSSTVLEAARSVAAMDLELTAVTNDLRIAMALSKAPRIRTVVLGGTLRRGSATTSGEPGADFLKRLHVDLALMGIHSVCRMRMSETSVEVASMKRRMIDAAHRAALLIDASKFREPTFCEVGSIAEIDIVVTDAAAPAAQVEAMRAIPVEVRMAGETR